MYLGLKVGPDNWRDKLHRNLGVQCVEVYLNLGRLDEYLPLFSWLNDTGVQAALHISSLLDGGLFPNLATADDEVRRASADLIRRTLDVAADRHVRYVVFHPGSYRITSISEGRVVLVGEETLQAEGSRWLIAETTRLVAYGRERGVELLAENLPGREFAAFEPENREQAVDPRFVPYTVIRELGRRGVGLCLDIGHLYAEMMVAGSCGKDVSGRVMSATRELAPYVRYLHLSTVVPPWNGTDSHNGFLERDYALGAVPTREQTLSWLECFAGREVWVIPEPDGGADVHVANYRLLREWMERFQ